jgi:hypothetical protein
MDWSHRHHETTLPAKPSPLDADDLLTLRHIAARPRDPCDPAPRGLSFGQFCACRRKLVVCGLVALDAPPVPMPFKVGVAEPPAVYLLTREGERFLEGHK